MDNQLKKLKERKAKLQTEIADLEEKYREEVSSDPKVKSIVLKEARKKKWNKYIRKNGIKVSGGSGCITLEFVTKYKYARRVNLCGFEEFTMSLQQAVLDALHKKGFVQFEDGGGGTDSIEFEVKL